MHRRTFLLGLTAIAAAPLAQAQPAVATFELNIDEVYDQLAGGDIVYAVAFRDPLTRRNNPPLKVHEGQPVAIKLVNRTSRTRSFAIMSVAGASSTPIRAGGSSVVRFKAPPIGNYIYNDPTQAASGETRTLFGDFVVLARKP